MKRVLTSLILAWVGGTAMAGELTPPAGPVGPSMKSLHEVEPRMAISAANTPGDADSLHKISNSGSYYLTGDVLGVAGKHGIEIDAALVTLDLRGCRLIGVGGSLDGIHVNAVNSSFTVRDGSFHSWGDDGIDGYLGSGPMSVEDVSVVQVGYQGIVVPRTATVARCRVQLGGWLGIVSAEEATLSHCAVSDCGRIGIAVSWGSNVSHCTASRNGQGGISAGSDSVITSCSARDNGSGGIGVGPGSKVTDCAAGSNAGAGIFSQAGTSVTHCAVRGNTIGIDALYGTIVEGCAASANLTDGIRLSNSCTALNNTCRGNGADGTGAGVLTTGVANRIDGNHVVDNDYGVRLTALDNLVVRNSARNNTSGNFSFPASGEYGLIITNPGPNFAATNPWANFAY